jgi:hypothetical protein
MRYQLNRLRLVHNEGAVFFACSSCGDSPLEQAKNKALEYSLSPYFGTSHPVAGYWDTLEKCAWSPTRHSVFNRKNSYRLARCSTESVLGSSASNCRFRLRKCSIECCHRIEIGCAFFVTFFAQAKKVNQTAAAGGEFAGKQKEAGQSLAVEIPD